MTTETANKLDEIVERLRLEKAQNAAEWLGIGKTDGLDWASDAPYADLKDWAGTAQRLLQTANPVWEKNALPEDCDDAISDCHEGDRGSGFDYAAYAEGWFNGVRAFWDEVRGKL